MALPPQYWDSNILYVILTFEHSQCDAGPVNVSCQPFELDDTLKAWHEYPEWRLTGYHYVAPAEMEGADILASI